MLFLTQSNLFFLRQLIIFAVYLCKKNEGKNIKPIGSKQWLFAK